MSSQCAAMMLSAALHFFMASRIVSAVLTPRPSSEKPQTRPLSAAMSVSSPSPFCPIVMDAYGRTSITASP